MNCPACRQEIKDDSRFCPKCGKTIPRCPGCGKVLTKRTRFCTYDGTLLPEELLALIPEQNDRTGGRETIHMPVESSTKRKKDVLLPVLVTAAAMVVLSVVGFTGYLVMDHGMPSFISEIFKKDSDADSVLDIKSGDILAEKDTVSETETEQTEGMNGPGEIEEQQPEMNEPEEIEEQTGTDADAPEEPEGQSEIDAPAEKEQQPAEEASKKQEDLQKFGIDDSAVEDYEVALDPDAYQQYDSGISDFSFYYPAGLYNDVAYDGEPEENSYGTNVESVSFKASGGSGLVFAISKRTDNLSMEEITDYIYEKEAASIVDSQKLLLAAEEDYGRVIVTGYTLDKSKLVYDMVKAEPDYVLCMKVIFTQYAGEEDQLQKGYVTECIYRLCGFSGSSKMPRSYQEYKEGQQ